MSEMMVVDGLLFGADAMVCSWVNARLNGGVVLVPARGIGILNEDSPELDGIESKLVGGVYYFNYHKNIKGIDPETQEQFTWSKISVAVASDSIAAADPDKVARILHYPFNSLGCDLVTAEISLSNHRAIREAEKLGFRRFGEVPSIRPGGDLGYYGLKPEWCSIYQAVLSQSKAA